MQPLQSTHAYAIMSWCCFHSFFSSSNWIRLIFFWRKTKIFYSNENEDARCHFFLPTIFKKKTYWNDECVNKSDWFFSFAHSCSCSDVRTKKKKKQVSCINVPPLTGKHNDGKKGKSAINLINKFLFELCKKSKLDVLK